jgi:hypothetical protein
MPLQSSGQISLNDLHVEAGGTTGTEASMNDSDIRGLLNASANSQMTFSSFYGASAGIGQIAAGNSTYTASTQYTPAYQGLYSTDDVYAQAQTPGLITNRPPFTLNNRSTRFVGMWWSGFNGGTLVLNLADLTTVPPASYTSFPANNGWTSVTLSGNGQTITLNRTAVYIYQVSNKNLGGTTHQTTLWQWINQSNIFPTSHNTTSFTVSLT